MTETEALSILRNALTGEDPMTPRPVQPSSAIHRAHRSTGAPRRLEHHASQYPTRTPSHRTMKVLARLMQRRTRRSRDQGDDE